MRKKIIASTDKHAEQAENDWTACKQSSHIPNKKTLKAIRDFEEGKGLIFYKNPEDFFKKFR